MGTSAKFSNFSNKQREKICLECKLKCIHYQYSSGSPFYPIKPRKIPEEYRVQPSLLYAYCKYYDPINTNKY